MRNLKALARMPAEPTSDNFTYRPSAKHPNPLPRTEPDPALICIHGLPRVSVQG